MAGIIGSLAAVGALVAPGGEDETAPERDSSVVEAKEAADQAIRHFYAARWDALWRSLHPVDQALISRESFVRCQEIERPADLLTFKTGDPIAVPSRVRPKVPIEDVRAVDGLVRANTPDSPPPEERSVHTLVAKDGEDWKPLLPENEYEAFRRDRCPYEKQTFSTPHIP